VLEAFPDLQKIDEDRLEFYVPSDPSGPAKNDILHYARISGPAWARLDQVAVVRIGIRASADELECRESRSISFSGSGEIGQSTTSGAC
jgi:hypothetical protein